MKSRIINNIFKQGFKGAWRNRGMGLASISSIAAVLIILGSILILVLSVNNMVDETKTKFDDIQIFLVDEIEDEDLGKIRQEINKNQGVRSIEYQSKEDALEIMKEDWGDEAYLLEGLEEENYLPASFVVHVEDIQYADGIVESTKDLDGVESVKYYNDIIERFITFEKYIRLGGLALIIALIIISIFIISNTVKLTVFARKREINIMKYVGASNGYIRGPFIIEGIVFGIIGAGISFAIVYFGYKYLFDNINDQLYVLMSLRLLSPQVLLKDIVIIFITLGVGIGSLGSLFSLKRHLNV